MIVLGLMIITSVVAVCCGSIMIGQEVSTLSMEIVLLHKLMEAIKENRRQFPVTDWIARVDGFHMCEHIGCLMMHGGRCGIEEYMIRMIIAVCIECGMVMIIVGMFQMGNIGWMLVASLGVLQVMRVRDSLQDVEERMIELQRYRDISGTKSSLRIDEISSNIKSKVRRMLCK